MDHPLGVQVREALGWVDHDSAILGRYAFEARETYGALTLAELEAMPTPHSGQYDNLKIETADCKVWLSRLEIADGAPFDNGVTVERLVGGSWVTVAEWEAS